MLTWLSSVEGPVLLWLQEAVRNPILDPIARIYTQLGNAGLVWIAVSLALLCRKSTRRAGAAALLAMVLGLLCTNVALKHLVARPRPWLDVAGLLPLVNEQDPNSFPSGHTCAAFACAGAWLYTLPKGWMKGTGLALAALMGLSRMYVGVHYPSDVLVGALVGLLCGWAAVKLLTQWERRRDAPRRAA